MVNCQLSIANEKKEERKVRCRDAIYRVRNKVYKKRGEKDESLSSKSAFK
jgi:hypothetical protein